MINDVLFALWFFAPAAAANMAPIFANNLPVVNRYNYPLDSFKTYRDKRIFGSHKTVRGLISGVVAAAMIALLQLWLFSSFGWAHTLAQGVDYSSIRIVFMGAAMGLGAIVGDAVKSFFKRQVGVQPGTSWVPFDQIDFIIGGLLLSALFVQLSLSTYLTIFVITALLHPVMNVLGWLLHLKSKPF